MHIAVIQETDWRKRGPHQQHHLMERLSLRGHHISVFDYPILRPYWPQEPFFTPAERTPNAARIYPGAQIDLRTPATLSLGPLARPSSMLSHHRALAHLINTHRPDIVVSYALSTGLPAYHLARRAFIPYVFHVIDALHTIVPGVIAPHIAKAFERYLFRHADRTVLINDHLLDYAVAMGAPPERARVLRTGVDLGRFNAAAYDREGLRAAMGIRPGEYVLFFMGWLYSFSGVRQVAEQLLSAPDNTVRLLVAGDGDDFEALAALRDQTVGARLILTGRVPYERIPPLLACADVCLLPFERVPATEHIVPIKLYEYMAAGKPVISSELPGVMRDVGEGSGVRFTPAEKQVELALALRDEAAELGRQARRFTEAYCDWETITDDFEALLLQQIKRGITR